MRREQNMVNTAASDERFEFDADFVGREDLPRGVFKKRLDFLAYCFHPRRDLHLVAAVIGTIIMPELTVYLIVSPEVQAKRMGLRGMSPGDRRMVGKQDVIREKYAEIIGSRSDVVAVDTTYMTQDEVLDFVLARVRSWGVI